MDTKSRFEKPQKATLDKDTIKNEKYKKYWYLLPIYFIKLIQI